MVFLWEMFTWAGSATHGFADTLQPGWPRTWAWSVESRPRQRMRDKSSRRPAASRLREQRGQVLWSSYSSLQAVCRPALGPVWPEAFCMDPKPPRAGAGSYLTACLGSATHKTLGDHRTSKNLSLNSEKTCNLGKRTGRIHEFWSPLEW